MKELKCVQVDDEYKGLCTLVITREGKIKSENGSVDNIGITGEYTFNVDNNVVQSITYDILAN